MSDTATCRYCGGAMALVFGKPPNRCPQCGAPEPAGPATGGYVAPGQPPPGPYGPPPGAAPPGAYGPPGGYGAPVGYQAPLPLQASGSGSRAGLLVGMIVLSLVIAGAGAWLTMSKGAGSLASDTDRAAETDSEGPAGAGDRGSRASPGHKRAPTTLVGTYFDHAADVKKAIADKLGASVELREIVFYDKYVIMQVRDSNKRTHIDNYTLRAGAFDQPRPEHLRNQDVERLDQTCFKLDGVPFDQIARVVADAKQRIQLEEGKVTHVIIDQGYFIRRNPMYVRVYISSERQSGGYVRYDAHGKMLRVFK